MNFIYLMIMYQYRLTHCKKCHTLMQHVNNLGERARGQGRALHFLCHPRVCPVDKRTTLCWRHSRPSRLTKSVCIEKVSLIILFTASFILFLSGEYAFLLWSERKVIFKAWQNEWHCSGHYSLRRWGNLLSTLLTFRSGIFLLRHIFCYV